VQLRENETCYLRIGHVFEVQIQDDFRDPAMCRSIKTLFNFEPPATADEIHAASLQFVRKLSGFNAPSKSNEDAFQRAVADISKSARELIDALVTTADPRDRTIEAERARAKSAARFGILR
jgi:hypothetical protein